MFIVVYYQKLQTDTGTTAQVHSWEGLERDFKEVLQELVGDHSLERFKAEYERLHIALKRSHENEKKLVQKCRSLKQIMEVLIVIAAPGKYPVLAYKLVIAV